MAKTKKHLSFYQRMDQEETFEPKKASHEGKKAPSTSKAGFKRKDAGKGCNCGLDMCKKCWLKR